jgi:hypothetical protein
MPNKKPRKVRFAIDTDGERIALVPLANQRQPAKLLAEDLTAVLEAGYTDQWTCNSDGKGHGYVRCGVNGVRGNLATVARLIVEPPKGYRVTYLDGDRLNLRRDNLKLEKGARPKKYPDEDAPAIL